MGSGAVTLALAHHEYRLHWLAPAPPTHVPRRSPGYLLDARREVVPFRPRAEERGLTAWLDDPVPLSVQLLHGPAGRGKTRLANHFATSAHAAGWSVAQADDLRTTRPATVAHERPDRLLVVVDYAERWSPDTLVTMVSNLPLDFPDSTVRVLLLTRSPASWRLLAAHLDRIADLREPVELAPPTDRAELFTDAASAFTRALDLPTREIAPPDLTDYGSMLLIHMAALAAVCADRDDDPRPEPDELSAYLLHHERRFWPPETFDRIAEAVFLATLFGPTDAGTARHLVDQDVLRWHDRLYPEPPHVLGPLRPDRLGEDYVAQYLADEPRAADLLTGLPDDLPTRRALIVLAAAADRHPHVRPVLWRLLGQDRARLSAPVIATVIRHAPHDVAWAIVQRLPVYDVDLLHPTADLVRHVTAGAPTGSLEQALLYQDLSLRLWQVHDQIGALNAIRTAVALFRQLSEKRPELLFTFAQALNTWGSRLAEAGETARALGVVREGVAITRQFTAVAPQLRMELAVVLMNAARIHAMADDLAGTVSLCRESVTLLRDLPDDRVNLPHALHNLGLYLARSGRKDEGAAIGREAIALWEALANEDPSRHLTDLADARLLLAAGQVAPGEPSSHLPEALDTAIAAHATYRKLAEHDPGLFSEPLLRAHRLVEQIRQATR
ncbi:hypothetical protein GCM10009634_47900 [Saccharothrix xinjiangensis]